MHQLWLFFVGFVCSYLGSIPPGVINISVLQYGLHGHKRLALRFGFAACLIEFLYATGAVRFQLFLEEHTRLTENFELISGILLVGLGIIHLANSHKSPSGKLVAESPKAFRKGLLIGLANLMVIPFWLGVTAYLQNHQIIKIHGNDLFTYVAGVTAGTFGLLVTVAYLAHRFQKVVENRKIVNKIPGLFFLAMGIYSFYKWFFWV